MSALFVTPRIIRIGVLSKCISQYEFMTHALCDTPNTWMVSTSSVVANRCHNSSQETMFRMRITFEPRLTTDRES